MRGVMRLRRLGSSFLLLLVVACAQRPATDTIAAFASSVTATTTAVDIGLQDLSAAELNRRTLDETVEFVSSRRGPRLPNTDPTNAEWARGMLKPSFEILAEYARQLTAITGDSVSTPLAAATDALQRSFNDGLAGLQKSKLKVSDAIVNDARTGSSIVLAITERIIEHKIANDVAEIVQKADPAVRQIGMLVTAAVGQTPDQGLRLALHSIAIGSNEQSRVLLGLYARDHAMSAGELADRYKAEVARRDVRLNDSYLAALLVATDRMVRAHAALIRPAEVSTRQAVGDFADAVQALVASYQRLHGGAVDGIGTEKGTGNGGGPEGGRRGQ